MATILDVAKEAGVSKSTVSRVINKAGPVKEETKAAIEQAIKKLKYSPSYFAQGIRTGKTKTIAMLVPEYTNIFYSEMFRGVEDIALKYGYMVLVCNTERNATSEMEYAKALLRRKVDGIIYNTYEINQTMNDFLQQISDSVPVVFMNRVVSEADNVSYVVTDGYNSTREAVQYLFHRGKKKIGYVRNTFEISVTDDRYEGYLRGLADCGLPANESWIYREKCGNKSDDYIKLGKHAGTYYAGLKDRPDAILTAIDMMALGCIKQMKEMGIRIPQDMNVIGFDNISLDELYEPALSTISQPIRELGQKAAQIIISKINGETVEDKIMFDGKLIIRETTD